MRNHSLKVVLLLLIVLPANVIHGITFDGIEFIAGGGGYVKFSSVFTATNFYYLNGLNTFTNLVWNGRSVGVMGFDCELGSNMTITAIGSNSVTYLVNGAGVRHSYVKYAAYNGPLRYTGATNVEYNQVTGVATVTTIGSGYVTLYYGEISQNVKNAAGLMSSFLLIVIIVAVLKYIQSGGDIKNAIILFALGIGLIIYLAQAIELMGY